MSYERLTFGRVGDGVSTGDITWLVFRFANPNHGAVEYDKKGQLLAVKDADGNDVERYVYDKAGNMVKKVVRVRSAECRVRSARKDKITTFTFDGANQLVSSTTDGVTTHYTYDAAGRLSVGSVLTFVC